MRKLLLNFIVALALVGLTWPQAQPKPAPSPSPQATAPATAPGSCPADYYRNVNGVCVHRPVRTQGGRRSRWCDGPMSRWFVFVLAT
jgi:hypothetical protein